MSDIDSGLGHPRLKRELHIQSLHLALAADKPRTSSVPSVMWPRLSADSEGSMYEPSILSGTTALSPTTLSPSTLSPSTLSPSTLSPSTLSHMETAENEECSAVAMEVPSQDWTTQQQETATAKRQYYDDIFTIRDPFASQQNRKEEKGSLIIADIKTNINIRDEFTFCSKISQALSTRYQRDETSVMFSVVQSACLFFGGTFDPAYILTITAIPTQLQPVTNKRNAYLLEKVIEDELGITPSRGVIRFMPLPAENLALGGRTWEVDTAELEAGRPRTSRLQSLGYEKRKQSLGPLRGVKSRGQVSAGGKYGPTPPNEPSSPPPVPEHPMTLAPGDIDAINAQRLQTLGRRKKSFAEYLGLRQY